MTEGHRLQAAPHQQKPSLRGEVKDTMSSSDTVAPCRVDAFRPGMYSFSGSRSR